MFAVFREHAGAYGDGVKMYKQNIIQAIVSAGACRLYIGVVVVEGEA